MGARLDNKVALITGTGGGQGRAAALRFAAEGALVIGSDVKIEGNADTERLVKDAGGHMTGMAPVDLGDPDQAKAWVEQAAATHGRIDIVYNNAADPRFGHTNEISIENYHHTIRNELDLVFYVTKFAWPYLVVRGGVIISVASTAAWMANPGLVAHSAAKGGVVSMSRVWAYEGSPHGIRAVTISPGTILTPATKEIFADAETTKRFYDSLLIKRLGEPEEIAAMAAFLASDDAAYITGADFRVDGGEVPLSSTELFVSSDSPSETPAN